MKLMLFFLALVTVISVAFGGSVAPGLRAKVRTGEVTEAILELPQVVHQLETHARFQALTSRDEKAADVASILKGLTSLSQAPYMSIIKSLGLQVTQFWASNIILVKGISEATLDVLGRMKGDFVLREQHRVSLVDPSTLETKNVSVSQNPQWGVAMIRAPAAWVISQGEGCVAVIVDTGVNIGHEALAGGYAGAWRDTYFQTAGPTDQNGHGSAITGVVLGRTNGIGVAPRASWIACRGLNHQGSGTESALVDCAQFSITANPRPQVSSNSWGGGAGGSTWYDSSLLALRNAGIIPVFAAGGSGGCGTIGSPADRRGVIAVGSTTTSDAVPPNSARGPSSSTGDFKPEFVAPGVGIVTAGTGMNNYVTMSGSSLAVPHVSGSICLLMSAHPEWGFEDVMEALGGSAAQPPLSDSDRACGLPFPGEDFPNNAYGHGRIDVGAALGV